jgi:hypothetical protein
MFWMCANTAILASEENRFCIDFQVICFPQRQGDQIGRIFASLVIALFGQFKITEVAQFFGLLFSRLS